MESLIDITDIIQKGAVYIILGVLGWVGKTVHKNQRDVNALFRKTRRIYREAYGDDWEKKWED